MGHNGFRSSWFNCFVPCALCHCYALALSILTNLQLTWAHFLYKLNVGIVGLRPTQRNVHPRWGGPGMPCLSEYNHYKWRLQPDFSV